MPGLVAEVPFGLALISSQVLPAFPAEQVRVPVKPLAAASDLMPGLAVEEAFGLALISSQALPAFPAEQVRALFVLTAAESAGELSCHAAGNGNSGCVASAVAPPGGDTCLLNTAAGRQAAGLALEQSCDSTCPIHFDAAPNYGPSAHPSGAAHSTATRESTQEAAGSSALGYAG